MKRDWTSDPAGGDAGRATVGGKMTDEAYHRRRAEQHRKLAATAASPAVRSIHFDLAMLYEARAKASGAHR